MKRRGLLKNRRWKLLNIFRMPPNRFGRNRRGISTTIEYVLFISLAITMSLIVYVWLKSYIPKEPLGCSDGVSILLQEYDYNCNADIIKLDLKNNGRFNIDGYFIKATNSSTQTLAIKDLAKYTPKGSGNNFVDYISDSRGDPGGTITDTFNILPLSECQTITGANPCIYSLEIIPIKVETINDRERTLSCTSAKIRQEISCTASVACTTATESTDCTTSPYSKCKPAPDNICVQCLVDGDCTNPTPACTTTNVCVKCTDTNDDACTGSTPNCDIDPNSLKYQTCVEAPSGPLNTCGDGVVKSPNDEVPAINEECDLGPAQNGVTGSGCTSTCTAEIISLGYFGFESGTQGWSVSTPDSDRSNDRSKVLDNGVDGGSSSFHIQKNSPSSITLRNFNFANFKEITVRWQGYYTSFENNDCLHFKVDGSSINNWGENGCTSTITENSWLEQSVILTNTNPQYTLDDSVELKFEGEMNSDNDDFYIDGISITGKKY